MKARQRRKSETCSMFSCALSLLEMTVSQCSRRERSPAAPFILLGMETEQPRLYRQPLWFAVQITVGSDRLQITAKKW
jgi:hypothetical protein